MKIGIISDTHGDKNILRKIAALAQDVEHWLHAGDHYTDAVFLAKLTKATVTAVTGNCDYQDVERPQEERLEINGAAIWLTHGHKYNVKYTTSNLIRQGSLYQADIVVFGHTHVPYNKWHDGILIFNPGSPTYPRGENMLTFGIITISGKNNIKAGIFKINA